MDLLELQKEVEARIGGNVIETTYRNAIRMDARSEFNQEVLERATKALEFDVVGLLIANGYRPSDFPQIMTQEFDYGNEVGVAISVKALREDVSIPIGYRMLIILLRKNRELKTSLLARTMEVNHLEKRVAELTRPSLWSRFVQYVRNNKQGETHGRQDD